MDEAKPTGARHLRVFICYASEDIAAVMGLYDKISPCDDIDVWLDRAKLLAGQDWDYEITKALELSDVVVVCLSGTSVDKDGYVQKEIKCALEVAKQKPEGVIFLIPIRLDECEIPRSLRRWQWIDVFASGGHEKLLNAFRERARTIAKTSTSHHVIRPERTTYIDHAAARFANRDRAVKAEGETPAARFWQTLGELSRRDARKVSIVGILILAVVILRIIRPPSLSGPGPVVMVLSTAIGLALLWALWGFEAFAFRYIVTLGVFTIVRRPCILLRSQSTIEDDELIRYVLQLSFVNRSARPLALNSIVMHVGDYVGSGPGMLMYTYFATFSSELRLTFIGHLGGRRFPVVKQDQDESSMGSVTVALVKERGLMAPNEQLDLDVTVKVSRPPSLRGRYPDLWSLGGQIVARYETTTTLKERIVRFPDFRRLEMPGRS